MPQTSYSSGSLDLERCPHCRVANPLLAATYGFNSSASSGHPQFKWRLYICSRCGMPVIGGCPSNYGDISIILPKPEQIDASLPEKALAFLQQAVECLHAPSGAIMLCASAVDAMLKEKGLKSGSLYKRIEAASQDHLITPEMAKWAHEVRLDANDERHADEAQELPNQEDAKKCIDFTKALGDFLFVLPGRVERGLKEAAP